jgi:muramoyltetrapeptide carboxypeptidase
LTHLRLSGTLDTVHAIVAGPFGGDWEQAIAPAAQEAKAAAADAGAGWHRETLLALGAPVAYGLPSGHAVPNLTLPLGVTARLDASRGELRVG